MGYFSDLTLTEAFAEYGAILGNRVNEYSAIAKDGSVVVGCWLNLIDDKKRKGTWRYEVPDLSAWDVTHGVNLLKQHLKYSFTDNRPVRLVLVIPKDRDKPEFAETFNKTSGRNIPKTYQVRKDFIGKVVAFDGNHFIIDFQKELGAPVIPPRRRG